MGIRDSSAGWTEKGSGTSCYLSLDLRVLTVMEKPGKSWKIWWSWKVMEFDYFGKSHGKVMEFR